MRCHAVIVAGLNRYTVKSNGQPHIVPLKGERCKDDAQVGEFCWLHTKVLEAGFNSPDELRAGTKRNLSK